MLTNARLPDDGTASATVVYSTSGFALGDVLTLALQVSNSITTTGRYGYSLQRNLPDLRCLPAAVR